LAVGDIGFQKKCLEKMRDFHQQGVTTVIISHSLDLINSFCQKVYLLDSGQIRSKGPVKKVINDYQKLLAQKAYV